MTYESPHPHADLVDEIGNILVDTTCRRCGYNLRGLHQSGRCPECGTAIGLSLLGDLLRYADPRWLDRVYRGCWIMLWGLLITVVASALIGCLASIVGAPRFVHILGPIGGAVSFMGVWLLTSPDPSAINDERFATSRRIVRFATLVGVGQSVVAMMAQQYQPSTGFFLILGVVSAVGALVGGVGEVAKFYYFKSLAERIPNPTLATRARWVAIGYIICYSLLFIGGMVILFSGAGTLIAGAAAGAGTKFPLAPNPAAAGGPGGPGIPMPLMAGGCVMGLVALVMVGYGILALTVIHGVGKACREQAMMARQIAANYE